MNIPHVGLFAVIKKKSLQEYIELTIMKQAIRLIL